MDVKKIIFIGFRGTGKTSVGKEVAKLLNWDFIDLDEYIQKKAGKTVKEIVEKEGWESFRKMEKEAMKEVSNLEKVVIALGGGAVLHREEMEFLKKGSSVIWLCADVNTILERIKRDEKSITQRPSLTDLSVEEEIKKLLAEREKFYKIFCDIKLETDLASPEKLASTVIQKIFL